MVIDIRNRQQLNDLLNTLNDATEARWGIMKAQNMLEHLAIVTEYTNGKKTIEQRTTDEEAKAIKQKMIYTDSEIPQGLKSPLLGDTAEPFIFSTLEEAKNNFNRQLDDFEEYFKNNPYATCVQPRMGPLNYSEWVIFHNKHITHHFKQFGLI